MATATSTTAINLFTLISDETTGGTWGTTSICGGTSNNPSAITIAANGDAEFSGAPVGTYTFFYSVVDASCGNKCTTVTVIAESCVCLDATIDRVTSTNQSNTSRYDVSVTYTINSAPTTTVILNLKSGNETGDNIYSTEVGSALQVVGTHTITITGLPAVDSTDATTELIADLCCLQTQLT